jgi:hypothetical protein
MLLLGSAWLRQNQTSLERTTPGKRIALRRLQFRAGIEQPDLIFFPVSSDLRRAASEIDRAAVSLHTLSGTPAQRLLTDVRGAAYAKGGPRFAHGGKICQIPALVSPSLLASSFVYCPANRKKDKRAAWPNWHQDLVAEFLYLPRKSPLGLFLSMGRWLLR